LADFHSLHQSGYELSLGCPVRVVQAAPDAISKRLQAPDDESHFLDLCLQLLLRLCFRMQLLQMLPGPANARLELVLVNQPLTVGVNQLADLSLDAAGQHLPLALVGCPIRLIAEAQPPVVLLFDAVWFNQQRRHIRPDRRL
jgi:hypothetical protein